MLEIELIILGIGAFVTGLVTLAMIQIGRIEEGLHEQPSSPARVPEQAKASPGTPVQPSPHPV